MLKLATVIFAVIFSVQAQANWLVDNEQSRVSFISVKKDHIAEVNQFHALAGRYDDNGLFELSIALNTVDTGIAIRDKRLKEYLFDVKRFPKAILRTTIDPKLVKSIAVGQSIIKPISASLTLFGQTQQLSLLVMITKTSDGAMLVNSVKPIIIKAAAFGLVDGIDKLAALAGLERISYSVPVSFVLRLAR